MGEKVKSCGFNPKSREDVNLFGKAKLKHKVISLQVMIEEAGAPLDVACFLVSGARCGQITVDSDDTGLSLLRKVNLLLNPELSDERQAVVAVDIILPDGQQLQKQLHSTPALKLFAQP